MHSWLESLKAAVETWRLGFLLLRSINKKLVLEWKTEMDPGSAIHWVHCLGSCKLNSGHLLVSKLCVKAFALNLSCAYSVYDDIKRWKWRNHVVAVRQERTCLSSRWIRMTDGTRPADKKWIIVQTEAFPVLTKSAMSWHEMMTQRNTASSLWDHTERWRGSTLLSAYLHFYKKGFFYCFLNCCQA